MCFQHCFCAKLVKDGLVGRAWMQGDGMKQMMMATVLFVGFGTLVLGAGNAPDPEGLGACGADQAQDLVGQPYDGFQDRFAATTRIIPPNSAITQDYRPDRQNVDLNAAGVITRIWCG
jgi:Peptidase inhibitor I78 family